MASCIPALLVGPVAPADLPVSIPTPATFAPAPVDLSFQRLVLTLNHSARLCQTLGELVAGTIHRMSKTVDLLDTAMRIFENRYENIDKGDFEPTTGTCAGRYAVYSALNILCSEAEVKKKGK